MKQYLIIEVDGLTNEDNTIEIQGRVERNLTELFAHEIRYYGWTVSAEEWMDLPVEAERLNFWKGLALTKGVEVEECPEEPPATELVREFNVYRGVRV